MIKRIMLTVAYDGTNYFGWQRQSDCFNTVQSELEKACENLFGRFVECVGASRTDRGVHALGQRCTIDIETSIPTERIPLAISHFLPDDIAVTAAEDVPADFHCRYANKNKTYEYKILNSRSRNPLLRNYTEFVYKELDLDSMSQAAKYFIGKKDFKAFCASGSSAKTTVRTIFDLTVSKSQNVITISVTGDGFLYNMVRIIAGTLIYVGLGKINPCDISQIIDSKNRTLAGKTVGPQGLTLVKIEY